MQWHEKALQQYHNMHSLSLWIYLFSFSVVVQIHLYKLLQFRLYVSEYHMEETVFKIWAVKLKALICLYLFNVELNAVQDSMQHQWGMMMQSKTVSPLKANNFLLLKKGMFEVLKLTYPLIWTD